MVNFFTGFRKFNELADPQQQDAPGMMNVMKKVQRVPKKLWSGMPFQVPARRYIELEGKKFLGPLTFYVTEFDNATVTLKLVNNPMDFTNDDDMDDEIDFDNNNDGTEQTFTISKNVFDHLQEPENFPGADYATASQGMKGGGL